MLTYSFEIKDTEKLTFISCVDTECRPEDWPRVIADRFGWVWFNDISTIVVYLMPNPVYIYISNIRFVNTFCR